jgi:hypothetical protein
LAGLFRSDTSGGSISLNASIFANKGPKGLAGTDCAGARGSLASPRPYCVYPHGWCARPVRRSRGTQSLLRRAWPATTLRNNRSILPEPIETVGAQLGTPHRVHDVALAQEVSPRGAPSALDLWTVMSGAPTSLSRVGRATVLGPAPLAVQTPRRRNCSAAVGRMMRNDAARNRPTKAPIRLYFVSDAFSELGPTSIFAD